VAAPILNLSTLNGSNGFRINGVAADDFLGRSVSGAGDVNGDGIDDLILGADRADINTTDDGASYVIFGDRRGFAADFNLSTLNGINGFRINGVAPAGALGFSVSGVGDVNGDSIDDLITGSFKATPYNTPIYAQAGQSFVVFGSRSGFGSVLSPATLNGSNGFLINGAAAGDNSGRSVSGAGDVNGDGIDDLIIGADRANPNGNDSGQSYVVFGRRTEFQAALNTSELNGSNGFRINGIAAFENSGFSVSGAGDVNGDGIDDLIIGAYLADVNGTNSGQSYVVFGNRSGFAADLNLSTLNGSNGFRINGITANDRLGNSVSRAGDVNGDGISDLIIGAFLAGPNGTNSGQSYVIFGSRNGFAANFTPSALNGSNGFRINGIAAYDISGVSVSGAGDVNEDGVDDLIIGANGAGSNGNASGQSYVVFGSRSGFTADLNLSTLNGSNGFRIDGIADFDSSGVSVSGAGDINGDGIDDLIVGAYLADPNGANSGQSYVIFGVASEIAGLTLNPPTVDAASVTFGSVNADLNTGVLTLNFTPRAVSRSIAGFVNVIGTAFSDNLIGNTVANTLAGNGGNDAIAGNGGDDVISGGAGDDSLQGGADSDLYLFNADTALGSDNLSDALGVNTIDFSATTTQSITFKLGLTTAQGVSGNLTLTLGSAVDITNANGGSGSDRLIGNILNNTLAGNVGDDRLAGGVGKDILTGGLGRDRFEFSLGTRFNRTRIGVDVITDFRRNQDKLVLDRATFNGLRKISFTSVKTLRQAQLSTAQLTYIRRTGALFFNANGSKSGFGNGGQFADLTNGLNLTARDIILGSRLLQ
jgi:hypothetical protein